MFVIDSRMEDCIYSLNESQSNEKNCEQQRNWCDGLRNSSHLVVASVIGTQPAGVRDFTLILVTASQLFILVNWCTSSSCYVSITNWKWIRSEEFNFIKVCSSPSLRNVKHEKSWPCRGVFIGLTAISSGTTAVPGAGAGVRTTALEKQK